MRRSVATALLSVALLGGDVSAQILDDTLVPRGQLRLQAHPVFSTWSSRFGRLDDGTERREDLGEDLTSADATALFPGASTLVSYAEALTGTAGYAPTLGPTVGRLAHDVTRIEFGGQLGVFDWLTIGVVVPWTQTRTALDFAFEPDTVGGADLGLNPAVSSRPSVDAYLLGLSGAADAAAANATTLCGAGPGAACTAARALADRTAAFLASAQGAYGASLFFPMTGSAMATSLASASATLDVDLLAAGIGAIAGPMVFASTVVDETLLSNLPTLQGAGIEGAPLGSRRGLWQTGDIEVSALVRLLRVGEATGSGPQLDLAAGFLVRLPTGTTEDPNIFLDPGTGDAQTDLEGRLLGSLGLGPLGLAGGVRYGTQRPTRLNKRVALPEVLFPPLATLAAVEVRPASYLSVEAVPTLRLTDELRITGQMRYFYKGRDEYALVDPVVPLDARVLGVETGVKLWQLGAGIRYSTVDTWRAGIAPRPIEAHLRLLWAAAGSGGQTPVTARVEAGVRLFRRFWGDTPTR